MLVTCLPPYGATFLNRVSIPRLIDTETYLGDILSFGELTTAFQLVPVLVPEKQQSALTNALHYVKPQVTGAHVPEKYSTVSLRVRELSKAKKFSQARVLMANHLVKEPMNSEGWAQVSPPPPSAPSPPHLVCWLPSQAVTTRTTVLHVACMAVQDLVQEKYLCCQNVA